MRALLPAFGPVRRKARAQRCAAALTRVCAQVAEGLVRRLAVAVLVVGALAAPVTAQAQQLSFERFGPTDGLTNLVVRCAVQDATGFIWLCTENGLFRFDGRRFERYAAARGVTETDIRSATVDAEGRVWVGTPSDLFVAEGDRFISVRPGGRVLRLTRPGNQIQVRSPNEVLFTEFQKALRLQRTGPDAEWTVAPLFSPDQLKADPALGKIQMVYAPPQGGVWLGCDLALCELRDGRPVRWGEAQGVPATPWRAMMRDRGGRLWARGVSSLVTLSAGAAAFEPRNPPNAEVRDAFNYLPLVQDRRGQVLTRAAGGLARWDGERWHAYSAGNGLLPLATTSLLVDRDGELWEGTAGRGFARWLGYGVWENWTAAQGLEHENVWGITRTSDGELLLAASDGCRRLPIDATRILPCDFQGLPDREINAMDQGPDGSVYVVLATTRLFRLDVRTRQAQEIATLPRTLRLHATPDGLWAVGDVGPIFLTPPPPGRGTKEWTQHKPSSYDKALSSVLPTLDGRLLFCSEEGLLMRRVDGRWAELRIEHPSGPVSCTEMAEAHDGRLWIATSQGLARVHIAEDRVVHIEWIDSPLLRDVNVAFLRFDARGWLWVGVDQGVVFFDGLGWHRADQSDGLVWNDTNGGAFMAERDGSVWIGTTGGLSHMIEPDRLRKDGPLRLKVTTARYGDRPIAMAGAHGRVQQLDWRNEAALEVGVSLLRPALSRGTLLRYRIPSLSPSWFETPSTEFRAPSLAPGAYRLEISARHVNAGLAAPVTTLDFEVLAPWWRTVWFEIGAAGSVLLCLAFVWRRRAKVMHDRQLHLERLLERATRDPLTGLWNRATILDLLGAEITKARQNGSPLAVAVIDIDHFKLVNDTHGHLGGDEVLRTLGRELAQGARQSDLLGRYGGEELLLVMPGLPRTEPSGPVERLQQRVGECQCVFDGKTIRVTASMGVQWWSPSIPDAQSLIAGADEALYAAKHAGRDRVVYADSGEARADTPVSVPA